MVEEKPLIAGEQYKQATTGAGPIDNLYQAGDKLGDGNWAEGMLSGAAGVSGLATLGADPLAGLAAAGFGWAMEHADFLKEPLDALTGDQQAIDAMSSTWANIGQEVQSISDDFTNAVKRDTASWSGEAADAYRQHAEEKASGYAALANGCTAAGTAVKMCGTLLSVARDIVRDLISQAVGEIISGLIEWAAAGFITAGTAIPAAIADVTRRAVKWASYISKWTRKVTDKLTEYWNKLDNFGTHVTKFKTFLEKSFGQSPIGKDTTIKRPKIGEEGLGTGKVHIDTATTAGNKLIGKTKADAAKVGEGEYLKPSDPEGKKDEQDPNHHTYESP